jgi:hypothetical protein
MNPIFTPSTISTISRFITLRQTTQSVLCRWEQSSGTLKLVQGLKPKIKFYLGLVILGLYSWYCVLRLIYDLASFSHSQNVGGVDILWTFLWGLYYTWSFGIYINTAFNQEDSIDFIMAMIRADKHLLGMFSLI